MKSDSDKRKLLYYSFCLKTYLNISHILKIYINKINKIIIFYVTTLIRYPCIYSFHKYKLKWKILKMVKETCK